MRNRFIGMALLWLAAMAPAAAQDPLSAGQTLYLPIYSRIWYGNMEADDHKPYDNLVSVLVSIRNTSLKTPIRIVSARYYDSSGKLLREYLPRPASVNPMATLELFIERKEIQGGSGANFVIQWEAASPTNPPIVQGLHVDLRSGQYSIVFTTTARPIQADK